MSGMLSVRRAVVIVCGLLQGLVVFFIDLSFLREQGLFFIDPSFLVNSHFEHFRAWIPACSLTTALCTAAFPPIFLQLRKGPL